MNTNYGRNLLQRLFTFGVLTSLVLTACGAPATSTPVAQETAPTPMLATQTPEVSVTEAPTLEATTAPSTMPQPSPALAFRDAMRKLWEDHITWTRLYIISVAADLPDKDQTAKRLLQNQEDIGNAVKPYYGEEAGGKLTTLLKEHIQGAVNILEAAKAGDTAKMEGAKTQWAANANQIAEFLNSANPDNWPLADLQAEMKQHLDLTLDEATARLNGKLDADVAAYDKVHEHILHLADLLSMGLIKQFPDKFGEMSESESVSEFHVTMRKLWEDHAAWTRFYIVEVAADLPNKDQTAKRLLRNQEDLGDAIKPYYGEAAGEKLTTLLKEHIQGAVDILDAAKANDTEKFDEAKSSWFANADEIATFLNGANPDNWPLDQLKTEMGQHLDLTLDEANNRLTNKWPEDIAAYDKVHAHILHLADVLSLGIVTQFPDKFK